ncbi:MAG TPA: S9 family peptidase [Jatrophihabitans sp.]|nr:S9 family peptidase [Jatrophihabitans sp.]
MPDETAELAPPLAARRPTERRFHGDVFVDEYEWLRDREDPAVLDYLRAENAYADARTAALAPLQQQVFDEIVARTKQTDLTVPVREGGYWYYSRTREGAQYRVHCRVPATDDGTPPNPEAELDGEQVLLDGNQVSAGSEFFSIGHFEVSPDGSRLAYSIDLAGDERFTLHVKDLTSGQELPDQISDTFYGGAWSADGAHLFYIKVDEAWRPYQVWRHRLGTDPATDVLVHTEPDDRFWLDVELTRNRQAIQISIASKLTSEVWFIDASAPESAPTVVLPRREGLEYQVEHAGDQLLIVHNAAAENFELATAPLDDPAFENWRTLIAGSPERRLIGVDAFAGHAVLHERRNGLANLSVLRRTEDGFSGAEPIGFREQLYRAVAGANPEWSSNQFRLTFGSLVTPDTVYDYDVTERELLLRKQNEVLGGVELSDYRQWREWAHASDGTRIPLSLVARADVAQNGSAPVLLYGYGSYEHSLDPSFSIPRLSLLDRGVVYVIAHVRGGGELGRQWYDQGKLLSKRNTFTDFIAAAEHLVATGWTTADKIVAHGGSAGGLLMGAVANMAPHAFGGITAHVPFVDALTTILDPSLPLTATEWEEWGNPIEDAEVYAYMKSYSPYENVVAQDYPPILAITSLNDTRVLYVEPAKWVAKLRATATGNAEILLKTEMDAGHGGRSGRYDAWKEMAFYLAWQLRTLGAA